MHFLVRKDTVPRVYVAVLAHHLSFEVIRLTYIGHFVTGLM